MQKKNSKGVRKKLERSLHDYTTSLRRYALVLTRNSDAAEDLVQETLVKAIAASESWQFGINLRVWMFRIMHNTHVSERRRHHVSEQALLEIGRIERTLFIIGWLLDAVMQRRAQIGLNKREAHHALKNALRIERQGEIRDRTTEGHITAWRV